MKITKWITFRGTGYPHFWQTSIAFYIPRINRIISIRGFNPIWVYLVRTLFGPGLRQQNWWKMWAEFYLVEPRNAGLTKQEAANSSDSVRHNVWSTKTQISPTKSGEWSNQNIDLTKNYSKFHQQQSGKNAYLALFSSSSHGWWMGGEFIMPMMRAGAF